MKTKICSKCKKEKSINEFSKDKRTKDGLYYWCKKCVKPYSKKYYEKNKTKVLLRSKQYQINNPIKYWCKRTIYNHKQKGYKILFTFKELLPIVEKTTYCPICEVKLDYSYGRGFKSNSPSLDRVDNEKFLTLDNIQIICKICNSTKQSRTMKEFYNYCKNFVNKFKDKI